MAMSPDCLLMVEMTAQVLQSKPCRALSYPMVWTVPRTTCWKSTYALVVISPAITTRPVAVRVSAATRLYGSCSRQASRMASETWSAILSGWPSVTDSEVNKKRSLNFAFLPIEGIQVSGIGLPRWLQGPRRNMKVPHLHREDKPHREAMAMQRILPW